MLSYSTCGVRPYHQYPGSLIQQSRIEHPVPAPLARLNPIGCLAGVSHRWCDPVCGWRRVEVTLERAGVPDRHAPHLHRPPRGRRTFHPHLQPLCFLRGSLCSRTLHVRFLPGCPLVPGYGWLATVKGVELGALELRVKRAACDLECETRLGGMLCDHQSHSG